MREGYPGVALALVTIQLTLAAITAFFGYDTTDFAIFQLLMLGRVDEFWRDGAFGIPAVNQA